jgi:ankyrin repeat protein
MPNTELLDAIRAGDADVVQTIVARDPEAPRACAAQGTSAVLTAVFHGRGALLPLLLPHVDLDLAEAAVVGDVARVRALLDADPAMLDTPVHDGWTALHLAAFTGQRDVAAALVARGASVAAWSMNSTANQPLHAALAGREEPALVRLLVESGADVNARAAAGWTPLHLAASRGNVALVDYLLERGADPTARADDGRTPAQVAEERGHPEAAARLEAAGPARS